MSAKNASFFIFLGKGSQKRVVGQCLNNSKWSMGWFLGCGKERVLQELFESTYDC